MAGGALEASLLSGDTFESSDNLLFSPRDPMGTSKATTSTPIAPAGVCSTAPTAAANTFKTPNNNNNNDKPPSSASIVTSSLLSPFSIMLKPKPTSNDAATANDNKESAVKWVPLEAYSKADLSLRPCRRVSVVVHVSYQSSQSAKEEDDTAATASTTANTSAANTSKTQQQLCLFPLIPNSDDNNNNNDNNLKDHPSPTSATLNASTDARDLVVVNPSAFGSCIPSNITMATARLVAQVANIESEDWARTYKFQHIIWPDQQVQSFTRLAQAMANDLLVFSNNKTKSKSKPKKPTTTFSSSSNNNDNSTSRVLIATGSSADRKNILFGRPKTYTAKSSNHSKTTKPKQNYTPKEILAEYGLLGATLDLILQELPQYAVCALSVYEIVQEDQIHDLLLAPNKKKKLQIRQPADRKGAIVEGLTEFPLDSLESLRDCLSCLTTTSQLNPRTLAASNGTYQGGHVIVTLKIWQSAVQHDLNIHSRCATLTFVYLATGDCPTSNTGSTLMEEVPKEFSSPGRTTPRRNTPKSPVPVSTRQSAFLRTSVSSLGGVLRGALLRQAGSDTVIPYRNSTLTKVLQRSLDHPECRVAVLASVSPLSDAYDETLATLRYVERLLVRTGLPKSPFEKRQQFKFQSSTKSSPDTSLSASPGSRIQSPSQPQILMEQFAGKEHILQSVVADPRQRLARFYRSQQQLSPTDSSLEESVASWWQGPGKSPPKTNYMGVDPGTIHSENNEERPAQSEAAAKQEEPVLTDDDEHEHEEKQQSISLAQYLPPLSPVAKQGEDEDSITQNLPQIQNAKLYPHYRPSPEARLKTQPPEMFGEEQAQTKAVGGKDLPKGVALDEKVSDSSPENPTLDLRLNLLKASQRPTAEDPPVTSYFSAKERAAPERGIALAPSEDTDLPLDAIGMYQDPTSKLSSAMDFFREIATLESSVHAMKNANHGIWQASALAIRQIKDFQLSQQSTINDLIAQRDNALEMARKTQSEYSSLTETMGRLLKEKDSEIASLKNVVDSAQSDRADVEKIAEEAIAAQDALEQTVLDLEQKLTANQKEAEKAKEELATLNREKDQVSEELYKVKTELFAARSGLDEKQDIVSGLEIRLKNVENERAQLSRLYADGDKALKRAQEELQFANDEHRVEREEWKKLNADLKRELKSTSQAQGARESQLSDCLARTEEELRKCRAHVEELRETLLALQEEHRASQRDKEKEGAALRQVVAELRRAHSSAEAERDDARRRLQDCQRKLGETEDDLARTREDLGQRISDVEELSMSLQQALEDQENLRDDLFQKERALENFQVETRHRLQKVIKYREDAAAILEKTQEENRALVETNEQLNEAMNRIRAERDDALRSRDASRKALSDVQNSIDALQKDRRKNAQAQYGLENERDALRTERDALRSESKGLEEMLRESQREHQNMMRECTKQQEAVSSLRMDLARKEKSFRRQEESFRAERDKLRQELLVLQQRDLERIVERTALPQTMSAPTKAQNESLPREVGSRTRLGHFPEKDVGPGSIVTFPSEREYVASLPDESNHEGRHQDPHTLRRHLHYTPDREHVDESFLPISSVKDFPISAPTEPRDERKHRVADSHDRETASLLPTISSHIDHANATTGVALPSSDRHTLRPRHRERGGEYAQHLIPFSRTNGNIGYYLDDEEDSELIIAALKRKVKVLERALILEGKSDGGNRR